MFWRSRDLMAGFAQRPIRFLQGGGRAFSKADRSRFLDVLDRVLRASEARDVGSWLDSNPRVVGR
jgi:uncharacterized protein